MKRQVTEALRAQFRPEFLNRVDEIIVFHALTEAELEQIVDLLLKGLERRLAEQDLRIELTPAARALIVREGTDPAFGARPLKRTIQRLVENPLARALLKGEFAPGRHDHGRCRSRVGHARLLDRSVRPSSPTPARGAMPAPLEHGRDGEQAATAAGSGGRGRKRVLDLPEVDAEKRDRDGGELVN